MAVGVVEEPEVIDVDERHADAPLARARGSRPPRRGAPTIEPWLSIPVSASRRVDVDELAMLPAEARLGGAEDEEEEPRQEHGGGEGDEHDVAAGRVEPRHEVGRVAPHARRSRAPRPLPSLIGRYSCTIPDGFASAPAASSGTPASTSAALGSPAPAARVSAVRPASVPTRDGLVAEEHPPIQVADLDADDPVALGQRRRAAAELADAGVARPLRGEVVGAQLAVDEELDQGGVAVDDPAERGVGQVVRGDRHERAGGHADEHEDHAEDERQEHRSPPIAAGQTVAQHVRGR